MKKIHNHKSQVGIRYKIYPEIVSQLILIAFLSSLQRKSIIGSAQKSLRI